jgi:hypothetical protein
MLAHSTAEGSNQLKLNLDALVSNLNLVNIIQQPKPIMIENVNNKIFSNYNQPQSVGNGGFNLINEDKLKMFSFLAERKLKEKDWHSKYFTENPSNLSNKKNTKDSSNKVIKNNKVKIDTQAVEKNHIDEKNHKNFEILFNVIPLNVKINEMKAICKHLMSSVENLEKVLNECKKIALFFIFVNFKYF